MPFFAAISYRRSSISSWRIFNYSTIVTESVCSPNSSPRNSLLSVWSDTLESTRSESWCSHFRWNFWPLLRYHLIQNSILLISFLRPHLICSHSCSLNMSSIDFRRLILNSYSSTVAWSARIAIVSFDLNCTCLWMWSCTTVFRPLRFVLMLVVYALSYS